MIKIIRQNIYLIILTLASLVFIMIIFDKTLINSKDRAIISPIKEVEVIDHKFSHLELSTTEYLNGISNYYIDEYIPKNHFKRVYGLSKDIINNIDVHYIKNNPSEFSNEVKIKISKPYNDFKTTYQDWKLIFTKSKVKYKDSSEYLIINNRFTLKNEEDKWKVLMVDTEIYLEDSLEPAETTDLLPEENIGYVTKYDKYNNKPVDYEYLFTIDTEK